VGVRKRLKKIAADAANVGLDLVEDKISALRTPRPQLSSSVIDPPSPSPATGEGSPTVEMFQSGNVPGVSETTAARDVDWEQEDALALALQKAQGGDGGGGSGPGEPKALYWDPYSLVEQLGYKEKPSAITYGTLAAMVWKTPMLNSIIQTRVNQVASFCVPQATKFDQGFRIRMRDFQAKPTSKDKKRIRELEALLLSTGYTDDARLRPTFEQLMRRLVRDTLTYDQINMEVLSNRRGEPAAWYAVDPSTVRLADTYRLAPAEDLDSTRTVQIYDQVVIGEFSAREMLFEVRNPRSDVRSQGYGTSEIEMMIATITQLLWAVNHNSNYFSQGTATPGLLNLKGAIPEKQMRAFRREWFQMISGNENAWRTPITNAEEIQWIPMHQSNRDMEFSQWLDFLIKVACGIFQMDPIEINFKFGSGGGGRSMFGAADKMKSVESKQKGLKPLLRFFESVFNRWIIWPTDPNYVLEFVGLEAMTPKELADLNTQRVRTLFTIDEMRAENDLEPLPDGLGEVILDANWLAHQRMIEEKTQQEAQQAQQAQLAAAAPAPGAGDQSVQGDAAAGIPGGGKQPLPGAPTPVPQVTPAVGTLQGDPATPEQIKELEALLRPTTAEKSLRIEIDL